MSMRIAPTRAIALGAVLLVAGCAGTRPVPPAKAPNAATASGAIGGQSALGAGTGASGIVDESYLYEQHAKARQTPSGKGAPAAAPAPRPPWSTNP